jgi:hypothetical protein
MRNSLILAAILTGVAFTPTYGSPPADVMLSLGRLNRGVSIVTNPANLPKRLKTALASTFGQSSLELADHDSRLPETPFVAEGEKPGTSRRLIFGFQMGQYWFVYYEKSYPFSAAVLVYDHTSRDTNRLIW